MGLQDNAEVKVGQGFWGKGSNVCRKLLSSVAITDRAKPGRPGEPLQVTRGDNVSRLCVALFFKSDIDDYWPEDQEEDAGRMMHANIICHWAISLLFCSLNTCSECVLGESPQSSCSTFLISIYIFSFTISDLFPRFSLHLNRGGELNVYLVRIS